MNQPNILILHCDQLRQDCLGFNGNADVRTPNLDRLAADSVNYENHYTVYPICTPSRYSFWSSLYVHQHGAWDNQATLPSGYPTFPGVLREQGYHTAAVGKMHMNPTYQDIGFSEMELAEQNGIGRFEDDYHRWLMDNGKIDRFDLHHQSGIFYEEGKSHLYDMCQCAESDLEERFYSTEWITRRAEEQIGRWEEDAPSVLMVGYVSPHHPFDPPAPYSTMYDPEKLRLLDGYTQEALKRDVEANGTAMDYTSLSEGDVRAMMAAYYGMISEIDDGIGRLIGLLKRKGLYENTMIIFTSDHGEYMGFHHMMLKCNYLYDPLAKIPLLVKYPGQKDAGRTESALSENIDVAPTVLEACGVKAPASMQGKSLLTGGGRESYFRKGSTVRKRNRASAIAAHKALQAARAGQHGKHDAVRSGKGSGGAGKCSRGSGVWGDFGRAAAQACGFCPVPFHREGISEPAGAAAAKAGGIGCAGRTDETVYPGAVVKRCAP